MGIVKFHTFYAFRQISQPEISIGIREMQQAVLLTDRQIHTLKHDSGHQFSPSTGARERFIDIGVEA